MQGSPITAVREDVLKTRQDRHHRVDHSKAEARRIRWGVMTDLKQPNIVFFLWDNLAWGEVGCYGGGVLRGAPTPRIDALAAEGLRLLNFNVEAQCTPSRSAV